MLGRKTPKEVFTGRKLEVGLFKIFECLVYCHVPSEKRMKLKAIAKKGIFIGYNENSKEYRVYIPSLRRKIFRRHVRFEEDKASRKAHGTVPREAGDQELETQNIEDSQVIGTGAGIDD